MKVLVPYEITEAMLTSSTVAEPSAAETAWVSGTTYAKDDVRIRTQTHRKYQRVAAGAGTTPPESDFTNWVDIGPTDRWALFDTEVSTASTVVTPMTYVLRPGFFNAIAMYGLDGANISVSIKDAPGGTVVYTYTGTLQEPPVDYYDWAFGRITPLTKLVLSGLVPYPDAELTVSVTAGAGVKVGAGMLIVGDLVSLVTTEGFGGTQYGATAEPVTYSYINTDEFGVTSIRRRRATTDMRATVIMPREDADTAVSVLQRVLDVPAAFIATDVPGYAGLNVFGLGSGSMSYDSYGHAVLSLTVKGMV